MTKKRDRMTTSQLLTILPASEIRTSAFIDKRHLIQNPENAVISYY